MASHDDAPKGPDLTLGVGRSDIPESGMLQGHVGDESVLVARTESGIFAIGATCSHYGAPLVDGVLEGETVRCPWHHACFSIRTGEALRAPAFDGLGCWTVEQRGDRVFVTGKKDAPARPRAARADGGPKRIVIAGGGAAGFAAAEMLGREGYEESLVMLSDDEAAPVDRPNLSKDYLAGSAPADWVPLRPASWYPERNIDLRVGARVQALDPRHQEVTLSCGGTLSYDRLLLATGAEPVRLNVPGTNQPHVHVLRSLADCQAIISASQSARTVVVIGASFIGLEVAAALRTRDLQVHVVAPDAIPLQKVFGPELGSFIRGLHEEHGVIFHLENTVVSIEQRAVTLKDGSTLQADMVVVGIGVRPRLALAEEAGLHVQDGVLVDALLQTSAPNIFAAGDIARWPDPYSGEPIRVEHWVVAERHGQTAALNMLGRSQPFTDVPFFWSQHYDVPINYVGHAKSWDAIEIEGDISDRDCAVRFRKDGAIRALASIGRDQVNLLEEMRMESPAQRRSKS